MVDTSTCSIGAHLPLGSRRSWFCIPSRAPDPSTLDPCLDCGQPATKLPVGGAGQPNTSLCKACEYRPASGRHRRPRPGQRGRTRWGLAPAAPTDLNTS